MLSRIFIIFCLSLIVKSDDTIECNSIYESINITDGFKHEDQIIYSNQIYSPEFYFVSNQSYDYATGKIINVKDHVRGCLCSLPDIDCIRLCCPIDHVFVNELKQCVYNSNITLEQYHEIKKSNSILIGKPCKCMYQLDPKNYNEDAFSFDQNGEFYLNNMGITYRHHESCLAVSQETTDSEMEFIANICYSNDESDSCDETEYEKINDFYPYVLIISIIFLLATILIYSVIPELNNLHGKCVLCYVCGLLLAYSTLVYLRLSNVSDGTLCVVFGFTSIYGFIFSFLWLNVMCVDMFITFRGMASSNKMSNGRKFIIYSIYTWSMTLAMLIFAIIMQFTNVTDFSPDIGINNCWVKKRWDLELIYLYLPIGIILIINTTLFVLTALKIRKLKQEAETFVRDGDSRRHSAKNDRANFILFLRLFIVMGITWIFEVISWLIEIYYEKHWISYMPDICNALQGFFIFFFVVWNTKVKTLIVKRYRVLSGLAPVPLQSRKTSSSYNANTNSVSMQ